MAKPFVTPSDGCAWVTGASSGIGRDIALKLSQEGWTVAASARSVEALNDLVTEAARNKGRVHAFPLDIARHDDVRTAVEAIEKTCGSIALAILNAGIFKAVDATHFEASVFERVIDINLKGTIYCLEGLLPGMLKRGKGHLAIVSSVTGYGGLPTSGAYGATKAALNNLAETLEIELAPHGLRVTIVNPGFVDTPAQDDLKFPKPFIVSSEEAAVRIVDGLKSDQFEITFPRRFTYLLKLINKFLPKDAYINLVRKRTGWDKKGKRRK